MKGRSEDLFTLNKIVQELGLDSGPIQVKRTIGGQRIDTDGTILIGSVSGPVKDCPDALCHELGHFVEVEEGRLGIYGWGLSLREIYVMGQRCVDVHTRQVTERELRVHAYQAHLHEYFKVKETIESCVESLRWLPDHMNIPLEDGSMPFADGSPNYRLKDIERSRYRWKMNRLEELKETYTLDRFFSEFKKRKEILNLRVGTN
jgi:hypothetical protein